jgi:hypothetical protein
MMRLRATLSRGHDQERSTQVADQEPLTETIDITGATPSVSELLQAVSRSRKRVVLEEDGKPKAAVLSYREFEFFKQMKAQRDKRFKILEEIGEAFKDVPPEEIEREVAKALAEVRAEMREERRLQAEQAAQRS